MKKIFCFTAAVLFLCATGAHAAAALELTGNQYDVFIVCSSDIGDYCEQGRTQKDVFIFDDTSFGIGSFEEDFYGLAGNGDYSASGLTFDAGYDVVGIDSYKFTIRGLSFLDVILFGKMDIESTEFAFPPREEAGTAFFLGIKK